VKTIFSQVYTNILQLQNDLLDLRIYRKKIHCMLVHNNIVIIKLIYKVVYKDGDVVTNHHNRPRTTNINNNKYFLYSST